MTITVGSHVTFTQRTTYRPYLHTVTGRVTELRQFGGQMLAIVRRDDGLMPKLVYLGDLRVVEATDDIGDVPAVHPTPYELMAELDDLYVCRMAGALGFGVEA